MEFASFKEPDAAFRILSFWSWNDKLDERELRRQVREMGGKGWGGFFCHARPGLVTGYLSDDWMRAVNACADEAGKAHMGLWLYDEDKWPSGYASGWLAENPAHRDRCLKLFEQGKQAQGDTVLKEISVKGKACAVCVHVMPTGDEWFNGMTYGHMMDPDTVKAFLDRILEKYKAACGERFGSAIRGVFTDEPCYFMDKYYRDNTFVPMDALPWSERLPTLFERAKGYSLLEHIEELFLDLGDYRRTRYDFFDTATRMFVDSFTKQYGAWCGKNGISLTGHFMGEDTMALQAEYIGAAMPHYEHMQIPGVDKLCRDLKNMVSIKQLTSVVEQLDKPRACCEAFGCMGQQASFRERKWVADWEAVLGISMVGQHLSLYSMRGDRKRDYPTNFFIPQPWWSCEKHFADYLGRLNYAVAETKRQVELLVLHPIAGAWSEYAPDAAYSGGRQTVQGMDDAFRTLSEELLVRRLDFHYGDEMIMEKHARLENGRLVVGGHAYSTVVLPSMLTTLRSGTYRLLRAFCEASADNLVIAQSCLPQRLDGQKADIRWPASVRVVDSEQALFALLERRCPARVRVIDLSTGEKDRGVLLAERSDAHGRYAFLANSDFEKGREVALSIDSDCMPVAMDLSDGTVYRVPCERSGGRVTLHVGFEPAGSLLLLFAQNPPAPAGEASYLVSGVRFYAFEKRGELACAACSVDEPNVFRLDRVTLTLDGRPVLKDERTAMAWYDHFYRAADGTPFTAEYRFTVRDVPRADLFAVVEMAENLDSIRLNGAPLHPLKPKGAPLRFDERYNWKDLSWVKAPVRAADLRPGVNVLTLIGKKVNNITGISTHAHVRDFRLHEPTELENVFLVGDFRVRSEDGNRSFFLTQDAEPVSSRDITGGGYPFYAGTLTAAYALDGAEAAEAGFLRLDGVRAACCEVFVNDRRAAFLSGPPYLVSLKGLCREGTNVVKVKAYTTLFNLLGPNHIRDILSITGVGPYTFVHKPWFTEENTLLPFGVGTLSLAAVKNRL